MNSRRARSLADYFRAANRHKLVLLMPTLVLALASGMALKTLPNLYESTSSLIFVQAKSEAAADFTGRLNELTQQVTNREVLEAIVNKCMPKEGSSDAAVLQTRDRIAIKPDANRNSQPGTFTVSYRATEPETA